MRKSTYNELLIKGLKRYKELEFADIPPKNEIDHVFSEKYEKNMEKIAKKLDSPLYPFVFNTKRKTAVLILCILLLLSSIVTVVASKDKLVDFFYEIFETYSCIKGSEETKEYIEIPYIPSNIPTEYTSKLNVVSDNNIHIIWGNNKNQTISFIQHSKYYTSLINSEDGFVTEKTINGTPCLFVENKDYLFYSWMFDGYDFSISYPVDLGEEFIEDVIGKLSIYEGEADL